MLRVHLFLVLLGCAVITNALLDGVPISLLDNVKDQKIRDFLLVTVFANYTEPQPAGDGRYLYGGTQITGTTLYQYVVAVMHTIGFMTTGVAINQFWILFNPSYVLTVGYACQTFTAIIPGDLTVYSGHAAPVTAGKAHKVKKYKTFPSAPINVDTFEAIGLLNICPGLMLDKFPTIPAAPIGVNIQGVIISWQNANVLAQITKLSDADSATCLSLQTAFLGGDLSKSFCTKPDIANYAYYGSTDVFGSPFIAAGDQLFGILSYFNQAKTGVELFIDLSYYASEIENAAPKY